MFTGVRSSFYIDLFIIIKFLCFFVQLLCQSLFFSDTCCYPALFYFHFCKVSFSTFTSSLCISFDLKQIYCKKHIYGSCFLIHSDSQFLQILIGDVIFDKHCYCHFITHISFFFLKNLHQYFLQSWFCSNEVLQLILVQNLCILPVILNGSLARQSNVGLSFLVFIVLNISCKYMLAFKGSVGPLAVLLELAVLLVQSCSFISFCCS